MKVGDLVTESHWLSISARDCGVTPSTGIVIRVIDDVEVPPVVEVLWDQGNLSKTYQDELQVINAD